MILNSEIKIFKKSIVVCITSMLFFACKKDLKEIQELTQKSSVPAGFGDNIKVKNVEFGLVSQEMTSSKYFDFSNGIFPYKVFPEGIEVKIFEKDEEGHSNISSKYAVYYQKSNLISLIGDVIIRSKDGLTINSEQMFFDQKNEIIFTDYYVELESENDFISGYGFFSNKEFTNAQILKPKGHSMFDE